MLPLLLLAISFLALYFIVRKAVMHGVLDAVDDRQAREHAERLKEQLRKGNLPDAPRS